MRQDPLELQIKRIVVDGLQDVIERLHGVALYGILHHVGHEHQSHTPVNLPEGLRRLHAGHQRHLNVHEDQVVVGLVGVDELEGAGKVRDLELEMVLCGISCQALLQYFCIPVVVLNDRNIEHPFHPPHA